MGSLGQAQHQHVGGGLHAHSERLGAQTDLGDP